MIPDIAAEAEGERHALLRWWAQHLPDTRGGFYGEIGLNGLPVTRAPKSIILHTRLLWFFSAMRETALAARAFNYLRDHFLDGDAVVWKLDSEGHVMDATQYAHAQGSTIYALAEYRSAETIALARRILTDIQARLWTGAFYRDHVSDHSGRRTLGAHLHLMEGVSHLHAKAPDAASQAALRQMFDLFISRFASHNHVPIVCRPNWKVQAGPISHGHDAEAGWLIWKAAEALGETVKVQALVLRFAETTLAALNADGTLPFETRNGVVDRDGEWWGQTEALILFAIAWQISGKSLWRQAMERMWEQAKTRFGAGSAGPWSWYPTDCGRNNPYLVGMWKCPFHTGRAMIELSRRLRT